MPSGELDPLAGVEQPEGHKVAGVQGPRGVGIACECGRWQAFVTGRGSASFAGQDYREHVRVELEVADLRARRRARREQPQRATPRKELP